MTRIPQTSFQKELAAERVNLQVLLDDHPTPRQREAAEKRIIEIDAESKVDGYLAARDLQPANAACITHCTGDDQWAHGAACSSS